MGAHGGRIDPTTVTPQDQPEGRQVWLSPNPLPEKASTKRARGATAVGIAVSSLAFLALGFWAGSSSTRDVATATMVPTATTTIEVPTTVTARPKAASTPKSSASPKPAASIADGTWTVGTDVPAGRYKVAQAVTDDCYWEITRAGSNGSDIIQNDMPSGGKPEVTLRRGHVFQTKGCGSWERQ